MWWISCELIVGTTQGCVFFFFSSRRRHTRLQGDWSSDVCSSDLCSTRCRPHARPNCWPSCRSTTEARAMPNPTIDRKSTRLNSSHLVISYAVFCLKKKKNIQLHSRRRAPPPPPPHLGEQ